MMDTGEWLQCVPVAAALLAGAWFAGCVSQTTRSEPVPVANTTVATADVTNVPVEDVAKLLDRPDPVSPGTNDMRAMGAHIHKCWSPPRREGGRKAPPVTVEFELQPDGRLDGSPRVVNRGSGQVPRSAADRAVRAVETCAPYDMLPREDYEQWKKVTVTLYGR